MLDDILGQVDLKATSKTLAPIQENLMPRKYTYWISNALVAVSFTTQNAARNTSSAYGLVRAETVSDAA